MKYCTRKKEWQKVKKNGKTKKKQEKTNEKKKFVSCQNLFEDNPKSVQK